MRNANERRQKLPRHCGSCAHHEWGDSYAYCVHPCKVEADDDELYELACDSQGDGVPIDALASDLINNAIADQEWQPYDSVCDYWAARHDRAAARRAAVDAFARYLRALVSAETP